MADGKKRLPVEDTDIISVSSSKGSTPQIRATTWEDKVREARLPILDLNLPEAIRGTLVNIGRVGGGIVGAAGGAAAGGIGAVPGGAAGALLGGTAGDLAFQQLQRLNSRLFNAPPSTLSESLTTAGKNTVIDAGASAVINKLAGGLSKVVNPGRARLEVMRKLFPPNPMKEEITSAIGRDPNFNPTVAQATQASSPRVITDVMIPERELLPHYKGQANYLNQEAEKLVSKVGGPGTTREVENYTLAQVGSSKAKLERKTAEQIEDKLYDIAEKQLIPQNSRPAYKVKVEPPSTLFDARGNKITVPGKRTMEAINVIGPVWPKKAYTFANTVINDIDGFLNDPTNELGRDATVVTSLNDIKNRLSSMTNVAVDLQGNPIISYNAAKNTKAVLTDIFEKAPEGVRKRFSESIYALRNSLSADIKDSAEQWNPEARRALLQAYHQTKQNVARFESKLGKKVVNRFADPDIQQEQALAEAISSKTSALAYIAATRSRKEVGSAYLKGVLDLAYDTNGNFKAESAIQRLVESDDIARTVLSSDQRNGLKDLLRKMQSVPQGEGVTAKVAVNIRRAGATIGLSGGLISGIATGSVPVGAYTYAGIVAGFPLARKVVRNLMLDPQNARIMARLTKLPPGHPEAQRLTKILFKGALKGEQFHLQYEDGRPVGTFEAREDGRLHPVKE
jgi:hypothetical protein